MRYSIVAKGSSLAQIEADALKVGARRVSGTQFLNRLFCELNTAESEGKGKALPPGREE